MQIDGEALTVVGGIVSALAAAVGAIYRQRVNALESRVTELQGQLKQEMKDRITDAKDYTAMALKLQETVIVAVNDSKQSDQKVAGEISENTKATRELTAMLSGAEPARGPRRPMGSRP